MWASAPTNEPATCCVGVDALIDPTAQRPKGRRADVGIRPYEQITTRCVGVDALIDPTAQRPKGRRADVGIRPYE